MPTQTELDFEHGNEDPRFIRAMVACLGQAMAGHEARCTQTKPSLARKAARYDNPLTDIVNIFIAQAGVNQHRRNRQARIERKLQRARRRKTNL